MFAQISHMTSAQALMDDAKIFEMYAKCHKNSDENFIFSPFSVAQLLKMLSIGADEDGKAEIARLLKVSRDEVSSVLKASENEEALFCANSIWLQEGKVLPQNFCGILKADCGADVLNADFAKSADVRKKISYWAAQKTMNLVNDVELSSNPIAEMFLLNVAGFKKSWESQFDENYTRYKNFKTPNGNVRVLFMSKGDEPFAAVSSDSFKAIEIPYLGKKFSMILIKPIYGTKPSQITYEVYADIIKDLKAPANFKKAEIIVPRFSVNAEPFSISHALKQMGVKRVFENAALFGGLQKVDEAFTGAKIDVYEKGTIVTAYCASTLIGALDGASFSFDSPYMFFLVENVGNNILFMGVVNDPSKN